MYIYLCICALGVGRVHSKNHLRGQRAASGVGSLLLPRGLWDWTQAVGLGSPFTSWAISPAPSPLPCMTLSFSHWIVFDTLCWKLTDCRIGFVGSLLLSVYPRVCLGPRLQSGVWNWEINAPTMFCSFALRLFGVALDPLHFCMRFHFFLAIAFQFPLGLW